MNEERSEILVFSMSTIKVSPTSFAVCFLCACPRGARRREDAVGRGSDKRWAYSVWRRGAVVAYGAGRLLVNEERSEVFVFSMSVVV